MMTIVWLVCKFVVPVLGLNQDKKDSLINNTSSFMIFIEMYISSIVLVFQLVEWFVLW